MRDARFIEPELRRVEDAFAQLRPGRELDERLDALLDGRAPGRRSPLRVAAPAIAVALVMAGALALVTRDASRPLANAAPVDTAPVDTAPVDTAPVDTAPVDAAPVDAAQDEPAREAARVLAERVRFIDVPMGRLEVRAPSTVDVREGRAVVTAGSARLLEKGKPPRTLLAGQSIAWQVAPRSERPALGDDDIEEMLAKARGHEARGAPAEAADVLADLLARRPPPRVADVVSFQRATLLAKARNVTDACAALAEHAQRFPASDNAADVTAHRARLGCR